ncbi:hypothetical protein QAD02_011867 [Eretmocerus hayati]|uniref:Uncharacterized protein n=1 Tax=Eretmocerus hayati TaxID=131215 RepID=A0ACC2NZ63_9HYME|nr:hypothetical protein QAD02_011867 [Eretmocerus hayati]
MQALMEYLEIALGGDTRADSINSNCFGDKKKFKLYLNAIGVLFDMDFIIFGLVSLGVVHGHPSVEPLVGDFTRFRRSVGSSPASVQDYPYVVSLRYAGGHFCGGTIISEDIILTAAHCIDDTSINFDLLYVKVGSDDVNFSGSWYKVAKMIKHEKFKEPTLTSGGRQALDDVALLKLSSPIKLNNVTTKAIELFGENDDVQNYKSGISAGWGNIPAIVEDKSNSSVPLKKNGTELGEKKKKMKKITRLPSKLMHVKLNIAPKEKCAELDPSADLKNQFCTYTFGKKVCSGDSGGPFIIDRRQAGIVSWGNIRCSEDYNSGYFVEVAKYRKWIDEQMKTL